MSPASTKSSRWQNNNRLSSPTGYQNSGRHRWKLLSSDVWGAERPVSSHLYWSFSPGGLLHPLHLFSFGLKSNAGDGFLQLMVHQRSLGLPLTCSHGEKKMM